MLKIFWQLLVDRIEAEPKKGALFVRKLGLWELMIGDHVTEIRNSTQLSYCISFLILHGAFNIVPVPPPEESPGLVRTLLFLFNRGGEDVSLAFKPRKKARYANLEKETFSEEVLERVDSNVLWSLLAYCSKS